MAQKTGGRNKEFVPTVSERTQRTHEEARVFATNLKTCSKEIRALQVATAGKAFVLLLLSTLCSVLGGPVRVDSHTEHLCKKCRGRQTGPRWRNGAAQVCCALQLLDPLP